MKYLKIPTYFGDCLTELNDSEIGRLFCAMLKYADTDIEPSLKGNERYMWNIVKKFCHYNPPVNSPKGKDHWNWKGGITPENQKTRHSGKYQSWRTSVFKRDNFTCQICGQVGGELNAHHIKEWAKYPENRFDVNNGITLCKICHKKVHSSK